MSTNIHCFALLTLVISHMNGEVLGVKRYQSCPDNSVTECLKGVLISFGTNIDSQAAPAEIYTEEPNYICLKKNTSILLLSKVKRNADYKPLLSISKDSESYTTIEGDQFEDRVGDKAQENLCFLFGDWSPTAESETNRYEIYLNYLTPKTAIDRNNLLIFTFSLQREFSSFAVDRRTDAASGLKSETPMSLQNLDEFGCSGTSQTKSVSFYLQKHKFSRSNHGIFKMAFFYDEGGASNNADTYQRIKNSYDERCTPNAYKTIVTRNKSKLQVRGQQKGSGSSGKPHHLLLIV